ncbi:MAG: hypothetical protein Q8S73_33850 [Deltaproteobacteria bacterium]|nr:hypothetical protein [Deltaproteobacteria bacterium]
MGDAPMNVWEQLQAEQAESDQLWAAYEAARKRSEAARARHRRAGEAYDEAAKLALALIEKWTKAGEAYSRASAAEDKAFAAWKAYIDGRLAAQRAAAEEG